ncbi:MAG TPA: adenylate/guanylate cyclase domain-containing response regulator [Chloroflexi bacterium]|nr:adenylate/guanylate cyclase domain-containing response regulator [Chloroflexota bacterium]
MKNLKADIMVIDDTLDNLRVLNGILNLNGYKVRGAPNGTMGIKAVKLSPPDLILLDIMMPDMDGYEVCRRLKSDDDERIRNIPVIFISALDQAVDKVKAFSVGAVDYVTKPFQMEDVVARIETHLTLRRLQSQLELLVKERTSHLEEALARQEALAAGYSRFVPPEFLQFLNRDDITTVELGDQIQMEMTILFADIRSFTTLSEQMSPQDNFNFINAYLSRVGPVIRAHNGFIDKYIGDEIMALFPTSVDDALQAAIAILETVAEYNKTRQRPGRQAIAIGIGLHKGPVTLGVVGEAQRLEHTVISDAVNLAARLEGLSKLYGASIIVSRETLESAANPAAYRVRCLGETDVKGKQKAIAVAEILDGSVPDAIARKLQTKADFEAGLQYFQNSNYRMAKEAFERASANNLNDKAVRHYLKRVNYRLAFDDALEWDAR